MIKSKKKLLYLKKYIINPNGWIIYMIKSKKLLYLKNIIKPNG